MKKKHGLLFGFVVLMLAAMFTITLAGCGDSDSGDPSSPGGNGNGGEIIKQAELTINDISATAQGTGYIYLNGYNADKSKRIMLASSTGTKPTPNAESGKVSLILQASNSTEEKLFDFEDGEYDITIKWGTQEKPSSQQLENWTTVFNGKVTFSNAKAAVKVNITSDGGNSPKKIKVTGLGGYDNYMVNVLLTKNPQPTSDADIFAYTDLVTITAGSTGEMALMVGNESTPWTGSDSCYVFIGIIGPGNTPGADFISKKTIAFTKTLTEVVLSTSDFSPRDW
jgi:hypothetical protein